MTSTARLATLMGATLALSAILLPLSYGRLESARADQRRAADDTAAVGELIAEIQQLRQPGREVSGVSADDVPAIVRQELAAAGIEAQVAITDLQVLAGTRRGTSGVIERPVRLRLQGVTMAAALTAVSGLSERGVTATAFRAEPVDAKNDADRWSLDLTFKIAQFIPAGERAEGAR